MADYSAHLKKAKRNLYLVSGINKAFNEDWDWQVTIAYYAAVHLMNAHLAKKGNLHYKTHVDVKNALFSSLSVCKVPDDIYLSFVKLENYSRRSRYLCHEDIEKTEDSKEYPTYDKHLKKALGYLDKILIFFNKEYGESFDRQEIDCLEIKSTIYFYFSYKKH